MLVSRDHRAEEGAAPSDFADRLERFFRDNYTALVRQHARLDTVEDVRDAIHDVLLRLYQRYVDGAPEPDNLAAYANTAIRNALKDRRRQGNLIDLVPAGGESDDEASADFISRLKDEGVQSDVAVAWKQLFHTIFDRLPPKWVGVAAMAMTGEAPAEIGTAYGQDGYVLRRYARDLICKILWELAGHGDPLAESLMQSFCAAPPRRGKI